VKGPLPVIDELAAANETQPTAQPTSEEIIEKISNIDTPTPEVPPENATESPEEAQVKDTDAGQPSSAEVNKTEDPVLLEKLRTTTRQKLFSKQPHLSIFIGEFSPGCFVSPSQ